MPPVTSWYTSRSNERRSVLYCQRCGCPVRVRTKADDFLQKRYSRKRPRLCYNCDKRDRILLIQVNACIRLHGGLISIYDVMDLYVNTERAKELYFDPFKDVRKQYKGKDILTITDIEGWIKAGYIKRTPRKRLNKFAQEAREKIAEEYKKKLWREQLIKERIYV